jgi:KDO2-lipid IV(A) lauroyltransferase
MAYLLYYTVLLPLSYLPQRVLYGLGSALSWINWRLIGYRKQVVLDNMRRSFPTYTESEIRTTARRFFSFFFDTIADSIKQFSLGEGAAVRRCSVVNPEIVDHLRESGRSFIAVGAHYGNWEMAALSFPSQFPGFRVMGIYSPLKNEVLNRLFTRNRSRTGTFLVSRRAVTEYYEREGDTRSVDFFIADQSPSNARHELLHWTSFLGQPTAFLAGPERYALRYDLPVYYMTLRRVGRGCFEGKLLPITDTPRQTKPGFITEAFVRQLEREIERDPTVWLWTHRRWKREVPAAIREKLREVDHIPPAYSVP